MTQTFLISEAVYWGMKARSAVQAAFFMQRQGGARLYTVLSCEERIKWDVRTAISYARLAVEAGEREQAEGRTQ